MRKLIYCVLTILAAFSAQADSDLANELALVESWLAAQRAYDRVPGLSAAKIRRSVAAY